MINSEELVATVKQILEGNRGILACDESPGTMGKRFDNRIENNVENRHAIRKCFFSAPQLEKYIGGVILHEETLNSSSTLDPLIKKRIVLGIKTDQGLIALKDGLPGEESTKGLEDLEKNSKRFYELGARFAKWRSVMHIGKCDNNGSLQNMPSEASFEDVSETLSEYAIISQKCGLVPIIEPEVLQNGSHDIKESFYVTRKIISKTLEKCVKKGVCMEGALLKVNMVTNGQDYKDNNSNDLQHRVDQVSKFTVKALHESISSNEKLRIAGVVFLSGGLSESDSALFLNAINAFKREMNFLNGIPLHFSFARALQKSAITIFCEGYTKNKSSKDFELRVQKCLVHRCKMCHLATDCQYKAELEGQYEGMSKTGNFVKDNNY